MEASAELSSSITEAAMLMAVDVYRKVYKLDNSDYNSYESLKHIVYSLFDVFDKFTKSTDDCTADNEECVTMLREINNRARIIGSITEHILQG
jgi:hypothetical protein